MPQTPPLLAPHINPDSSYGKAALKFAHALTNRNFSAAHEQLSSSLRSSLSAEDLKENYERMINAYDSPPSLVDLTTTMEVWPDKQPNDIEWAYVTIAGADWAEAVTVVIANESNAPVVR
jgi:hypothetical protein